MDIKTIHERDLKKTLKSLGMWKAYKKGELKCPSCGNIITKENIVGFKKIDGEVYAFCNILCLTD